MRLRGETGGGFSTVDLAVMQRKSGCVELYKCGAAPSYLKRGGSVRRLCSDTPPAGLSDSPLPPDQVQLPVQAGDFLVLISDGIADRSCDEWLLNLLAGWNGSSADELTALILSESRMPKGPGRRLRRGGAAPAVRRRKSKICRINRRPFAHTEIIRST